MYLLAIETSCDETAVAVLSCNGQKQDARYMALGNKLYSQVEKHAPYGGVFPTIAKREHAANLLPLLVDALNEAGILTQSQRDLSGHLVEELSLTLAREPELFRMMVNFLASVERPPLNAIAVTHGPGLEPALWVGITFAQALSAAWKLPLIPVNHLEGHVAAAIAKETAQREFTLEEIRFPAIILLISGGHTELILLRDWFHYEQVGTTRDDAVGEAFDKVARLLNLPHPGGVNLANLAEQVRHVIHGHYHHPESTSCSLPRPMLNSGDLDFSFSGLKTAVLYFLKNVQNLDDELRARIAIEFENAVGEVLAAKTRRAMELFGAQTLIVGGGVSANKHVRRSLTDMVNTVFPGTTIYLPRQELATDNAIMIGLAGYLRFLQNDILPAERRSELVAKGNLKLHMVSGDMKVNVNN